MEIKEEEVKQSEGYNADNAEVIPKLKAGIVIEGVIIYIKDGIVKDHISPEAHEKWKGDLDQRAINILVQGKYEGVSWEDNRIFTYHIKDGKVKFGAGSNLGKYHKYYEKAPAVGDKVQLKTDADGYFRLVFQ